MSEEYCLTPGAARSGQHPGLVRPGAVASYGRSDRATTWGATTDDSASATTADSAAECATTAAAAADPAAAATEACR